MTKYSKMTHENTMKLSKEAYIARCMAWLAEFNDGKQIKLDDPSKCPVQGWVMHNNANCGQELVPSITTCEICGSYRCPKCHNHSVSPMSRVTGYISPVGSWNAGKQQELKDRTKHDSFER